MCDTGAVADQGRAISYYSLGNFPDSVYCFTVPVEGIRRWDDEALVYDVRLGGDNCLRHYAFYERWLVVNVSRNGQGDLVTERGHGIDWCFNCDITTPLFSVGSDTCYSVDLELDVLAGPDGQTHIVKDEDHFAASVSAGYINDLEAKGARHGLEELLCVLAAPGGLLRFLNSVCPLEEGAENLASLPLQQPVAFLPFSDVPLLLPDARRARYGLRD